MGTLLNQTTLAEEQEKSGKAIYRVLADEFRRYILTGKWEIGSIIPTEAELCDRFMASRSTIRKTLEHLSHEGYLERRAGKGTWVADFKQNQETWMIENISPLMPSPELVKAEIFSHETLLRDPSDPLLSIFQDTEVVVRLKIIRRLENTPVNMAHVYMRKEDASIVTDFFDPENDIYMIKVLERMTGKTNHSVQDTYEAALAVGEIADRLKVPPGSPLMLVTRFVRDAYGYLLEAVQLFMRTDIQKVKFLMKKHVSRNVH